MLPASLCVSGFAWQLLTLSLNLFTFSWLFTLMLGVGTSAGVYDGIWVLGGSNVVATVSVCCFSCKIREDLEMLMRKSGAGGREIRESAFTVMAVCP